MATDPGFNIPEGMERAIGWAVAAGSTGLLWIGAHIRWKSRVEGKIDEMVGRLERMEGRWDKRLASLEERFNHHTDRERP